MAHARFVFFLIAALIGSPWPAAAQAGAGSLAIAAMRPDGSIATGAIVHIEAIDGSHSHEVTIGDAELLPVTVPPGVYRVTVQLGAFRAAERDVTIAPGEVLHLTARLAPDGADASTIVEDDRYGLAYQTTFSTARLQALPTGGTLWSLIDTAHPFLISDRIDHGGLWSAEPARLGGYGSSFTQTSYLLDGIDVTDPAGLGLPLVYPDLGLFEAVAIHSAAMPADIGGPGPVISLVPRRPGGTWNGMAHLGATPRAWQQDPSADSAPPIARFDSFIDSSLVLAGPIRGPKLGFFGSARLTNVRRLERASPVALRNDVLSLFARAHLAASEGDQVRAVLSTSNLTRPYAARALFADRNIEEKAEHTSAQATWDRGRGNHLWAVRGGVQRYDIDPEVEFSARAGVIERLTDGPPLALAEDSAFRSHYRWTLGSTYMPSRRRWGGRDHDLQFGAGISGTLADAVAEAFPNFTELVDGIPARLWSVGRGAPTRRSALGINAFVSDRIAVLPGLTLTAGARMEHDSGSTQEASNTISWTHVSPRLSVRWRPARDRGPAITSGYSWYRHRLLLDYFNVGDPRGLGGYVYRWDDLNGDRQLGTGDSTELIGPVGPCCTGSVVNTIDPDLRRPSTREFLIGVEHMFGPWRLNITGIDRREHDLLTLVNTGVTASDYTLTFIQDPGVDIAGASGVGPLPIYNRTVDSFGRDRYLLTNDPTPSRYQGVEIGIVRDVGDRWSLHFGGTAYRSEGTGANRGYLPNENDQGLLGEAFTTPNAGTFARGRLFFDRAYVIKLSGAYRAPGDVRIALASRYQDGQPFARLVIAEGLNQGADIVQAYPRGGQRFTYTFTLDAKVDKELRFGRARVGVALEVFNLLDTQNEVEEDIVTGPAFRTITAVQPPRAFRIGVRVGF